MAVEAGLTPSTLTRPVKAGDDGTSGVRSDTIEKIVRKYGVLPPVFGDGASANLRAALRGFSEDAVQFVPEGHDPLAEAVRALIAGQPNADPWTVRTRALELSGYLPGDVVIVDLGREARPGEAVCAQINVDLLRGTADTAMRIYEKAGSAHLLVASSMDPQFRGPIAVDDRVHIAGPIIGMVRPMNKAA